jgi:transmembrane sensor
MKVNDVILSSEEIQSSLETTWRKIEAKENLQNQKVQSKISFLQKNWFSTAASVLVFCFLSVWLYNKDITTSNTVITYNKLIADNNEGLVEQTNNSYKSQIILLSDGSSVLLQPKSKLSYPKIFTGNKREVYLSGEGFFELVKILKSPFLFMQMRL